MDRLTDMLRDIRDHWDDAYWRADHPEFVAFLVAVVGGIVGLAFAYLQARLTAKYRLPDVRDV